MMSYFEWQANPRSLISFAIPLFKEHIQLILPAVTIGATVTGFRPLEELKKEQS